MNGGARWENDGRMGQNGGERVHCVGLDENSVNEIGNTKKRKGKGVERRGKKQGKGSAVQQRANGNKPSTPPKTTFGAGYQETGVPKGSVKQ